MAIIEMGKDETEHILKQTQSRYKELIQTVSSIGLSALLRRRHLMTGDSPRVMLLMTREDANCRRF